MSESDCGGLHFGRNDTNICACGRVIGTINLTGAWDNNPDDDVWGDKAMAAEVSRLRADLARVTTERDHQAELAKGHFELAERWQARAETFAQAHEDARSLWHAAERERDEAKLKLHEQEENTLMMVALHQAEGRRAESAEKERADLIKQMVFVSIGADAWKDKAKEMLKRAEAAEKERDEEAERRASYARATLAAEAQCAAMLGAIIQYLEPYDLRDADTADQMEILAAARNTDAGRAILAELKALREVFAASSIRESLAPEWLCEQPECPACKNRPRLQAALVEAAKVQR